MTMGRHTYAQINNPDDPNGPVYTASRDGKVQAIVARVALFEVTPGGAHIRRAWVATSPDGRWWTYPYASRSRAVERARIGYWDEKSPQTIAPTLIHRKGLTMPGVSAVTRSRTA